MAEPVEWFRPTSGRVLGVVGLVAAVLVLGTAVRYWRDDSSISIALGALFGGVLIWAAMLRPRVGVTPTTLVLRNMLETVHLPLAAVEELALRQMLAVRAGDRRYVSPALGRSWRSLVRSSFTQPKAETGGGTQAVPDYPTFVESRIRQLVDDARATAGVKRGSAEQLALADATRREPAWLEIGLLAVTGVALVLSIAF